MASNKIGITPDEPFDFSFGKDFFSEISTIEALMRLIGSVRIDNKSKSPFPLILIDGEWGSGKSSVIKTLIPRLLQKDFNLIIMDAWLYKENELNFSFPYIFQRELLVSSLLGKIRLFLYGLFFSSTRSRVQSIFSGGLSESDWQTSIRGAHFRGSWDWIKLNLKAFIKTSFNYQNVKYLFVTLILAFVFSYVITERLTSANFLIVFIFIIIISIIIKAISSFRNWNPIIIIDNLDRCTIKQQTAVLRSIYNYRTDLPGPVIFAFHSEPLEKTKTPSGNGVEFVRKIFDVRVRIQPKIERNFIEYAKSIWCDLDSSNKWLKLPGKDEQAMISIFKMASFTLDNNPRKMKHFLNTLISTYAGKEIDNTDIDKLAGIVLISELWPDFYKRIISIPGLLGAAINESKYITEKDNKEIIWLKDLPHEDMDKLGCVLTYCAGLKECEQKWRSWVTPGVADDFAILAEIISRQNYKKAFEFINDKYWDTIDSQGLKTAAYLRALKDLNNRDILMAFGVFLLFSKSSPNWAVRIWLESGIPAEITAEILRQITQRTQKHDIFITWEEFYGIISEDLRTEFLSTVLTSENLKYLDNILVDEFLRCTECIENDTVQSRIAHTFTEMFIKRISRDGRIWADIISVGKTAQNEKRGKLIEALVERNIINHFVEYYSMNDDKFSTLISQSEWIWHIIRNEERLTQKSLTARYNFRQFIAREDFAKKLWKENNPSDQEKWVDLVLDIYKQYEERREKLKQEYYYKEFSVTVLSIFNLFFRVEIKDRKEDSIRSWLSYAELGIKATSFLMSERNYEDLLNDISRCFDTLIRWLADISESMDFDASSAKEFCSLLSKTTVAYPPVNLERCSSNLIKLGNGLSKTPYFDFNAWSDWFKSIQNIDPSFTRVATSFANNAKNVTSMAWSGLFNFRIDLSSFWYQFWNSRLLLWNEFWHEFIRVESWDEQSAFLWGTAIAHGETRLWRAKTEQGGKIADTSSFVQQVEAINLFDTFVGGLLEEISPLSCIDTLTQAISLCRTKPDWADESTELLEIIKRIAISEMDNSTFRLLDNENFNHFLLEGLTRAVATQFVNFNPIFEGKEIWGDEETPDTPAAYVSNAAEFIVNSLFRDLFVDCAEKSWYEKVKNQ